MPITPKRLGLRLKQLRITQGLSQEALAHKAQITREYVNKLEAGRYDPTISVVQRLAKALKVSISELTTLFREGGTTGMTPQQIVAESEAVTGDTPNSKIEELLYQIARMKRKDIPLPKNASDYANWDLVQFNIHRNLKKALKELRKVTGL